MINSILPLEIEINIINNLSEKRDLARFGMTSKMAQTIAYSNELWAKFFSKEVSFIHGGCELKSRCTGFSVYSSKRIKYYLVNFIKELQFNQIGIFRCHFPHNPNFKFEVRIQFFNFIPDDYERIERNCCYETKLPEKHIVEYTATHRSLTYEVVMRQWAAYIIKCAAVAIAQKYKDDYFGFEIHATKLFLANVINLTKKVISTGIIF